MRFKNILSIENEQFALYATEDKKQSTHPIVVEVFHKSSRGPGIIYLVQRYERTNDPQSKVTEWINNAIHHGQLSPRPYQPGQTGDGTTNSCAIALFLELCRFRCLDPLKIYLTAYPYEKPAMKRKELLATKSFADWQGVAYPKEWTSDAINKTIDSLKNANYHQLANTLTEELSL